MSVFNLHATTVVGIIHNGKAAIGSDGQATLDKTVMKSTVKKVRKLHNGKVLAGFAGSTADAFTLFERYEEKLNEYNFDPVEVIRNYMNPTKKVFYKTTQPETTNQRVYKEIRTMLDTANATYRKKEEEKEKY